MVLEYFCPICQEEYVASDDIFITKCGHVFHQKCLHDWLVTDSTCPDCRTTCAPTQTFKVFIKYRDSEFVTELIKLMDENEATLRALQMQLNEAKPQQKNEDLVVESNLENQDLEKSLDISKQIAEKDQIIKDLETKLREKSLELEKEIRNSTLMIVEKMKLQQQLNEVKNGFRSTHIDDGAGTADHPVMENLNSQVNKINSNASVNWRTLAGDMDADVVKRNETKKRCDAVNRPTAVGNRGRIDDALFELFKYSKKLYRVGYRHIFYQDNAVFVRKDNNGAHNIKIDSKSQVDGLMRLAIEERLNNPYHANIESILRRLEM